MKIACLLPVLLVGSVGCVPLPVPHSSVNAPRFSGRIISIVTRRPIAGATVVLRGLDDTAVTTDATGHFLTRISRTSHLAGLYAYDDGMRVQIPPARRSDGTLVASHPGYQKTEIAVNCSPYPQPLLADKKVDTRTLPDIRLRPALR